MVIVVVKNERLLRLLDGEREVFRCHIALGSDPVGPKRAEGDGRTPEGRYRVCTRNPQSKYHLTLGVSYPSEQDAALALREQRITQDEYESIARADCDGMRPPWDTPLGGFIMIHGEHPDGRSGDWTAGCVAVTNADIETLWRLCPLGTEIDILP